MYFSILQYHRCMILFTFRSRRKKKKKGVTRKVFEKIDFRLVARNFFQIQWKLNYPCLHCPNTIYLRNTNYYMAIVLNDTAYSPLNTKVSSKFDYIVEDYNARMKMRLGFINSSR